MCRDIGNGSGNVDGHVVYQPGFRFVPVRNDCACDPARTGSVELRENATDRPQLPVERQFAQEQHVVERVRRNLADGSKHCGCEREIQRGDRLSQIRRREVHRNGVFVEERSEPRKRTGDAYP
jgi:hypothetical protein